MNSNKDKQKFFIIYQITNLINGKIYVGAHITYNVNDKYMGSSKFLKKDMRTLGRQNFKKDILHIFLNKEDMMRKEAEIVDKKFCHRSDTYNKMIGGINFFTIEGMTCVKDKDGNNFLIYLDDPRYISGELVNVNKGFKHSEEFVRMLKERRTSAETRTKLSEARLGMKYSEEWKSNMSKSHKEIQFSEEWKSNMSKAAFGKKISKETRKKMKDEKIKEFFVYDKEGNFVSKEKGINEYADNNNISRSTIYRALKNKKRFFYEFQGDKL